MAVEERTRQVDVEPVSISAAVAWLVIVPVAAWWSWVLFSFARAQAFMADCDVCVSPNYLETREAFSAEGIYNATANAGWLALIPASIITMPLSVLAAVLLARNEPSRWRNVGLTLAVAAVVVPLVFMVVAQDQISWISDFTD